MKDIFWYILIFLILLISWLVLFNQLISEPYTDSKIEEWNTVIIKMLWEEFWTWKFNIDRYEKTLKTIRESHK